MKVLHHVSEVHIISGDSQRALVSCGHPVLCAVQKCGDDVDNMGRNSDAAYIKAAMASKIHFPGDAVSRPDTHC